jgi:D-3-phosphoglycerate dehydrogenase / 2-oxoglutarate reductase
LLTKIILKKWWNNMKILVSSRSFGKTDSGAKEILQKEGLELIKNPFGRKMTEKEIIEVGEGVVGIIAGTEKITKKILSDLKKIKVISRYGIGMDNIDVQEAQKRGILIYNTPISPIKGVAELTISLMLNELKKINILDKRLKNGEWKPEMGKLLESKTVGIIGLGNIGKCVTEYLKPFKTKIIAYDTTVDKESCIKNNIKMISFKELLQYSDIITIHVPLTDKTYHMIGKKEFDIMKDSAIIINTSRGGIIKEDELYNAIKEKRIAGAAIDVFENEPNVGKLKDLDGIIITPHIATYTFETRKQMEIETTKNLIDGLKRFGLL